MPGRFLGLYALACMEAEGPVYGLGIARRIAERTEGAWRPGPGAIYPALRRLVARRLARVVVRQRRRLYRITPAGRALLRRIRSHRARPASAPDLSGLWAEVIGERDPSAWLLRRLRRTTDAAVGYAERGGSATFRRAARAIVRTADRRLAGSARRRVRGGR